ncbi:MAG: Zn-ribbon domain-containing OB-fold protein [Acidimicrobiales bacterium]|jgi:uncharacterized OB-fold protein
MTDLPARAPQPSIENQPFFDAAAEGRLSLPKCDVCQTFIWYPRERCPACHHSGATWTGCTGNGSIYSFTVVRKGQGRWRDAAPYVIAYVELDEGPRIMTNIVDVDPDTCAIGDQLTAVFVATEDGPPLLRFRPAT